MASLVINANSQEAADSTAMPVVASGVEGVIASISCVVTPLLIVGEGGTGKDFLAEQIHRSSGYAERPFVKLQCSTIREAELAAHTDQLMGARRSGTLTFGTLYLEDIADLDAPSQRQLLSVLREGMGRSESLVPEALPARLICATRHNLEERLVQFNEELYHRISRVCLRIPPLRHRREEILALLNYFMAKYSQEMGQVQPKPSSRLLARMESYAWPGNVRELKHVAYQLAASGDVLESGSLSLFGDAVNGVPAMDDSPVSLKDAAREASRRAERNLILKTLTRTGWNRKRAAQELRISYKALLYKLKDISLEESARQG